MKLHSLVALAALFLVGSAHAEVTIQRFGEVGPGVYRGSRPHNEDDWQFLREKGIKSIISLEIVPFRFIPEGKHARAHGFNYHHVSIQGSPVPPSERHVNDVLDFAHDPANQPVYIHCLFGRDRTSMVATLYQIYFLGVPKDQAYKEQFEDYGGWGKFPGLFGIRDYYEHHSDVNHRWGSGELTLPGF